MFITLDGGDGCGKSTQIIRLADYLKSLGKDVVLCIDPGSTSLGNAVRDILLNRHELCIADLTETFLFTAARTQMVCEVIRPALAAGKIVLSDRFVLSTYVYQGYAGGVPMNDLKSVSRIAVGDTTPDIGIVLDIPYNVALERLGKRAATDRMENKGEAYHQRVRDGFLKIAAEEPERYVIVDATPPPESIAAVIQNIVNERLTKTR